MQNMQRGKFITTGVTDCCLFDRFLFKPAFITQSSAPRQSRAVPEHNDQRPREGQTERMRVKEKKSMKKEVLQRLQTSAVIITAVKLWIHIETAVLTEQEDDGIHIHIYNISISLNPFKDNEQTLCVCYEENVASHIKQTKTNKVIKNNSVNTLPSQSRGPPCSGPGASAPPSPMINAALHACRKQLQA